MSADVRDNRTVLCMHGAMIPAIFPLHAMRPFDEK